jgi:hypothetical protein
VISITAQEAVSGYLSENMDNDQDKLKFLKWIGLVALVSLPLMVFLKKRKPQESEVFNDDESNIFASELKE